MKHAALAAALTLLAGAAQAQPVRFGDVLHAKFHHQRCLACHQFNNQANHGLAYTTHRNRYLCHQCHNPELTGLAPGEWMAPPGARMDYTGMNARDTCLLVKRNVGAGDVHGKLHRHLVQDHLIRWSFEHGGTPAGPRDTVPGGYAAWLQAVEAWRRDGMRCE